VHAASGRFIKLCQPDYSGGHPQWTHAHPITSPGGNYVVYNSDETGICQRYVVEIPQDMKGLLSIEADDVESAVGCFMNL